MGHEEFIDSKPDDAPPFWMAGAATSRSAFRSIESVNLVEVFQERVCVMKSAPQIPSGTVQDPWFARNVEQVDGPVEEAKEPRVPFPPELVNYRPSGLFNLDVLCSCGT